MTAFATIATSALAVLLESPPQDNDEALHGRSSTGAASLAAPRSDVRDIFARTLIADALLDADIDTRSPVIDRTIQAIVRHRRALPAGEQPAPLLCDLTSGAGELAQILLLFVRLGRRDLIATHCAPPLAVLLAYAEADGVIPNWILPETASAEDLETIASLVYALARWDARRFLGMIVAGARWVAARQRPDGSWASASGPDPYHGTWLALRLLGAVMPNHPAVPRAARFLNESRRPGSGWGADGSDPLATALGLLALLATRTALPDDLPNDALAVLATGTHGWPAPPFLRLERGRDGEPIPVDHGSASMTALFALKAILALPPQYQSR